MRCPSNSRLSEDSKNTAIFDTDLDVSEAYLRRVVKSVSKLICWLAGFWETPETQGLPVLPRGLGVRDQPTPYVFSDLAGRRFWHFRRILAVPADKRYTVNESILVKSENANK